MADGWLMLVMVMQWLTRLLVNQPAQYQQGQFPWLTTAVLSHQ
jgi:hypothetical protein